MGTFSPWSTWGRPRSRNPTTGGIGPARSCCALLSALTWAARHRCWTWVVPTGPAWGGSRQCSPGCAGPRPAGARTRRRLRLRDAAAVRRFRLRRGDGLRRDRALRPRGHRRVGAGPGPHSRGPPACVPRTSGRGRTRRAERPPPPIHPSRLVSALDRRPGPGASTTSSRTFPFFVPALRSRCGRCSPTVRPIPPRLPHGPLVEQLPYACDRPLLLRAAPPFAPRSLPKPACPPRSTPYVSCLCTAARHPRRADRVPPYPLPRPDPPVPRWCSSGPASPDRHEATLPTRPDLAGDRPGLRVARLAVSAAAGPAPLLPGRHAERVLRLVPPPGRCGPERPLADAGCPGGERRQPSRGGPGRPLQPSELADRHRCEPRATARRLRHAGQARHRRDRGHRLLRARSWVRRTSRAGRGGSGGLAAGRVHPLRGRPALGCRTAGGRAAALGVVGGAPNRRGCQPVAVPGLGVPAGHHRLRLRDLISRSRDRRAAARGTADPGLARRATAGPAQRLRRAAMRHRLPSGHPDGARHLARRVGRGRQRDSWRWGPTPCS